MDRIGDIIRQTGSGSERKSRNVCEICGGSYDYTNTLSLPRTGYYGYELYDTSSERYVCVCEDCIDALQEIINDRAEIRKDGKQ